MTLNPLIILRQYAVRAPETFPNSILFSSSDENLVIFDMYPKARYHMLVLPRVRVKPELDEARLDNLRSLLEGPKDTAHQVLLDMKRDAQDVKKEIEAEMIERWGYKWDIWMGFHGGPSMAHLHLHIISADLDSECLKTKKHYNSFHPRLGYFIHLDEVLSWFDAHESFFDAKVKEMEPSRFSNLRKADLSCFYCGKEIRDMPKLKQHLAEEIKRQDERGVKREQQRRHVEKFLKRKKEIDAAEAQPTPEA